MITEQISVNMLQSKDLITINGSIFIINYVVTSKGGINSKTYLDVINVFDNTKTDKLMYPYKMLVNKLTKRIMDMIYINVDNDTCTLKYKDTIFDGIKFPNNFKRNITDHYDNNYKIRVSTHYYSDEIHIENIRLVEDGKTYKGIDLYCY